MKSRRFFVRHGSNQHEVVWKLNLGSKIFHAVRPKGNVTACGKKYRLVDPPPEATDPSDCEDTCLECADEVIRIPAEASGSEARDLEGPASAELNHPARAGAA